ncbi:MAG TPA: CPBP family intramembrane metalloprotease [Deltaproteobacteria bacterium]|nr:CPBP family intramembrane metalloprotease [Deltaproteobacteria bacterium]
MTPRRDHSLALTQLALFLLGSLAWVLLLTISTGALARAAGSTSLELDQVIELLGPGFLGYTSILQIVGLGGLALGLAHQLPPSPHGPGLREILGIRRASPGWTLAAGIGGLTIWTFPSWWATRLAEGSEQPSTVELITETLIQDPLSQTWPLIFAIVVTAPLIEEIIFRGYLWSVLGHLGPPILVFLGSSALFALYHLDPLHVITLLPTALFFGLLRWGSGSIGPCVLAHFVNNAIGVLATQLSPGGEEQPLGLLPAVLGLIVAYASVSAVWAMSRRTP